MMYNLLVDLSDIAIAIGHAFRWLFGLLSTMIYDLIIVLYDLFEYLARAEILNSSFVQNIYTKVGFLLGLFMLFKLIFSLIQALIEPEKLNDKKGGYVKVLTRCVIAIVLLGITPTIFREAFKIQNLLIGSGSNSDNILYKLILGDANVDSSSFGRVLATEAYFAFYRDDEYPYLSNYVDTTTGSLEYFDKKVEEIKNTIREGHSDLNGRVKNFSYAGSYLNFRSTDKEYVVEFNELLSVGVGVAILWMLVMYCLQVATRVFQLAYLQLIAPIPILSYISDPDGSFKKWINQCISTFLDLFIRLAIIYFVVYFSSYIVTLFEDKNSELILSTGINSSNILMMTLFEVALLIGLLQFANKVPKLLKDLFPNLGSGAFDYSLKPSKQAKGIATFATGTALGTVGGMATGIMYGHGLKGRLGGAIAGIGRGALGGMKFKGNPFKNAGKGMSNQRGASIRNYQKNHDGSTFFGRTALGAYGASLKKESLDRELKSYDDYKSKFDFVEKELEKNTDVQFARYQLDQMLKTGTITSGVTANGAPVIDKTTGKQVMKTRKITADDIKKANERIKVAQGTALVSEIKAGNGKIINAMQEAEIIRSKGISSGYEGFTNDTLIYDDPVANADKMADAFKKNKNKSVAETNKIKNLGGSRHDEYKTAEANSKYNKSK